MTFLEEIKEELGNLRVKNLCCMKSEMQAVLLFGGAVYDGNVIIAADSFTLAKRYSGFLKRICNLNYTQRLSENAESYKFLLPPDILEQLGLKIDGDIRLFDDEEVNECCIHAFVRGAFLASGSVANPEKAYRMEIFSENEKACDLVYSYLEIMGVEVKKTQRKNLWVVYTNKSESVSDMLKVAEASMAVFRVLEAKVIKDKRNDTNRVINCDMANADRASENSYRETQAIRFIENTAGLDSLKPKLRQAAMLRLENEGASIRELAQLCDPPISKSTMNNRLNRLIAIAKELGEN